jgi:hypothetical protein
VTIDFNLTVLQAAQDTFGRPVTIFPIRSQPGMPPYATRGIFKSDPLAVQMEGGGVYSDQYTTLDIRDSELKVQPTTMDQITIGVVQEITSGLGQYEINDVLHDGQGATKLVLKRILPPAP